MNKFLIICLSIGFLFTTTSCLKKQNLDDDNLGAAIAPVELTRALGSGVGSYDYNEIKPTEFTSVLITQRIQDGITQSVEQQGITVESSSNTSDKLSLGLLVQTESFTGAGQSSQSTARWNIDLSKTEASTSMTELNKASNESAPPNLMFLTFEQLAFAYCNDSGSAPETCHKLQVEDIQYRVPITAASQHQCADVMNCFISAKKIQFDRLMKTKIDKDGKPRRIHYTVIVSSKVPFLSRMLQLCTRALYEMTGANQKVLADVCYSVNSYAFGR